MGLTHGQTMWSIIFPQGIKNCLPTYASEFIVLVKETAVVGYIGMTDLTKHIPRYRAVPWTPCRR